MLLLLCCSAPSWPQWKCSRNAPVKGCRSALWWEHDSGHLARYRAFWPIRLTTNLFKRFAIIQSQQHRYRTTRQTPQALAYLFIHWDIFSLALKQGSICVCVCVFACTHQACKQDHLSRVRANSKTGSSRIQVNTRLKVSQAREQSSLRIPRQRGSKPQTFPSKCKTLSLCS